MNINVEHKGANEELAKRAHEKMVLCRECKYNFSVNECPLTYAIYDKTGYDFCSYGEREE